MLRSDLLDVAPMPQAPATWPSLPVHVRPGEDEALICWTAALADALGETPYWLVRTAFGLPSAYDRHWWRRPDDAVVARIARHAGVGIPAVETLTFRGTASTVADDMPDRISGRELRDHPAYAAARAALCPDCLAADERPYVRRLWLTGWAAVCRQHERVLLTNCPTCGTAIRIGDMKLVAHDYRRCRKCGATFSGGGERVRHEAIALQALMEEANQSGGIHLPRVGRLAWSELMALIDTLLAIVWRTRMRIHRMRLFARIARDMAMPTAERGAIEWYSNYGGLLILAWLFEDMDARLPAMVTTVRFKHLHQHMAYVDALPEPLAGQVRSLLAPLLPARSAERPGSRAWVNALPYTAGELRRRAGTELLESRRRRLMALAYMRDGLTLEQTARLVSSKRSTVQRWIINGVMRGLEAMLEPEIGRSFLGSAEVLELAHWIRSDPGQATPEAITEKAHEWFWVTLPTKVAADLRQLCLASGPQCDAPRASDGDAPDGAKIVN